ncbi:MAG: ATP-binding cassette domain-containing protein [Bacteroidales bacterium]|nr:ATP-binding cassette domain-containing protein [Bacteroidales bacterium]
MSEEILKALMQLFAIIAKQDEGVVQQEEKFVMTFLASQLSKSQVNEYMDLFIKNTEKEEKKRKRDEKKKTSTSGPVKMVDSVRVMGICRKINRTLNHKQKVIVLARLFELINTEKKLSELRMEIISVVADAFNLSNTEYKEIKDFVIKDDHRELDSESILIINDKEYEHQKAQVIPSESLHGSVIILQIRSVDLYFVKYTGKQDVFLNSTTVYNNRIYLFAPGSVIKLPKGKPIHYSDIVATFMEDLEISRLSFIVRDLQFTFKTGDIGIRNINFSVDHGKLVGIMGASGSGKTTLVNALSGINKPSVGFVKINGIDLHHNPGDLEGVIGYIPQDDLLIEELTVFQNLYYNAKLCFKDKNDKKLTALVIKTLKDLGLFDKKDLKVGNPMNKTISGGQRKRLNIALELIREPSILFVDEPTSGLSSRDSENVMELLSELTQKGKLIFVVIHQPSSDIYKMFDRMLILDQGGYMVYYGNPVEAVSHFKTIDNQVNAEAGECGMCGNVTPELIFDIIEAEVVDEFGQYTEIRKISASEWEKQYLEKVAKENIEVIKDEPPANLNIPGWFKQFRIFLTRDLLSKISNTQYIVLNLLEAPLLGFILAFLIRYISDPNSSVYVFFDNENIPPYIFMSIVVALFLGLTVSAEEIFRDRKILKREKFLNLSRSSYLLAKITILIVISAIQSILFVIIGNSILGIQGMYFEYWLVLFTTFVFANFMGLNISSAFNSAVTIYILIPLLMIPQMALGGAMFSFDKLNRAIGSVDKVPVIADIMASRWAYEALMVQQFQENKFEKQYYIYNQVKSTANFKQDKLIPKLSESIESFEILQDEINDKKGDHDSIVKIQKTELALLKNEITKENKQIIKLAKKLKTHKAGNGLKQINFDVYYDDFDVLAANDQEVKKALVIPNELINKLNINEYEIEEHGYKLMDLLENWKSFYLAVYSSANELKEELIEYQDEQSKGYFVRFRNKFHNEHLDDIVRNIYEKNKILRFNDKLIRQEEPIYLEPDDSNFIGIRSHFYAPNKHFLGKNYNTFWFNVIIIWAMSLLLYIPLYYDHLRKIVNFFGNFKFSKNKKNKKVENQED